MKEKNNLINLFSFNNIYMLKNLASKLNKQVKKVTDVIKYLSENKKAIKYVVKWVSKLAMYCAKFL